mgnify:FL=1
MITLKLKSYTVYLNSDNQVTLAKCNITGKFVKLAYAKIEYTMYCSSNAVAQIKRAEYVDNKTSSIEKFATNTVLALYYALSTFFVVNFLVN